MTIRERVETYPTKYVYGLTNQEIEELLKDYPHMNRGRWDDAMMGNTCMVIDGNVINYHCDVITALRCATEDRGMNKHEFD